MARSGQEIQEALRGFVAKWQPYTGTERAEAQTFLNELFACYGTDRLESGAKFEDFKSSAGFMDLHWPSVCIIEDESSSRPGRLAALNQTLPNSEGPKLPKMNGRSATCTAP